MEAQGLLVNSSQATCSPWATSWTALLPKSADLQASRVYHLWALSAPDQVLTGVGREG